MTTPSKELNEILNHEDFIVLWIPSNDAPVEFKKHIHDLPELNSIETGLNHVKQIKSDSKVFLVLTNFESLLSFENSKQIQSIYIFQVDNRNIQFNMKDHPKLIDRFDNIAELIDRLFKDILLTYRCDLPITVSSIKEIKIEQTLTNLHENTLMFLWDQLFINYLTKSPNVDMNQLKENMVKQSKFEYEDNQRGLEQIEEFDKTCSSDNVFKWYSKDSFLYRLFNKAFRTRNIELICKFQYFVILLYKEFQKLSKDQNIFRPSVVYRGQILDEKTIENLKSNIGHLISMNTIVSTSSDEQIACQFIAGSEKRGVLFKINIPETIDTKFKPFIDISKLSSMKNEKEVLFFIGTVFSIDSVEQNHNDSTWVIVLTLRNEITQQIEILASISQSSSIKLFHHLFMKTDDFNIIDKYYTILTKNSFSSKMTPNMMINIHIAFMFSNLGHYEKAIELYKQAMFKNNISITSHESIVIHMVIGYLHYHSMKYDDAFDSYAIVLSLLDERNLLASELYSHIGDVWYEIDNENAALSCYKEALKIANLQDFPSSLNLHRNLISILEKQENFHEAIVYTYQLNEIDQTRYHLRKARIHDQILMERDENELLNNENLSSIERADLLYRIGLSLIVKDDLDQALKNLLEAKELLLKEPPSWDRFARHWSTLFDNIALIYLQREDYLKALVNWKQGINIRCSF